MADRDSQAKAAAETKKKAADAPRFSNKNPVVWGFSFVLLVFIVVAFVVAPIYSPMASANPKTVFGSYDGEEISLQQGNYFSAQYDNAMRNSGSSGAENYQAQYSALSSAFDQTVLRIAVLKSVAALGFSVSEQKINDTIIEDPSFQTNGRFDSASFHQRYSATEINKLKEQTRDQLIQTMVMQDIYGGVVANTKETDFIMDMGRATRSFEFVSFGAEDYPDSEVRAFAEQNSAMFRSLALAQITVAKKAEAETLLQQIANQQITFEDFARKSSIDMYKASAGVRGYVTYHDLKLELGNAELTDKVFSLESGKLSEIIPVSTGFAIFRADSAIQSLDLNDATAIKTVRSYLVANEKGRIDDYLSSRAQSFADAARKDGLDKAAKANGKAVKLSSAFPINFGSVQFPTIYGNFPIMNEPTASDGSPIANAGSKEEFFVEAFKLAKGEVSAPIVLNDSIIVLKLKEEKRLADADMQMLANFAPSIPRYFVSDDLGRVVVDQSKLVNNLQAVFIANFMPRD